MALDKFSGAYEERQVESRDQPQGTQSSEDDVNMHGGDFIDDGVATEVYSRLDALESKSLTQSNDIAALQARLTHLQTISAGYEKSAEEANGKAIQMANSASDLRVQFTQTQKRVLESETNFRAMRDQFMAQSTTQADTIRQLEAQLSRQRHQGSFDQGNLALRARIDGIDNQMSLFREVWASSDRRLNGLESNFYRISSRAAETNVHALPSGPFNGSVGTTFFSNQPTADNTFYPNPPNANSNYGAPSSNVAHAPAPRTGNEEDFTSGPNPWNPVDFDAFMRGADAHYAGAGAVAHLGWNPPGGSPKTPRNGSIPESPSQEPSSQRRQMSKEGEEDSDSGKTPPQSADANGSASVAPATKGATPPRSADASGSASVASATKSATPPESADAANGSVSVAPATKDA